MHTSKNDSFNPPVLSTYWILLGSLLCLQLLLMQPVLAVKPEPLSKRENVRQFIDKMSRQHNMDKTELRRLFDKVAISQDIIDLMNRPAEKVKPWYEYQAIFLTDKRLKQGLAFWKENRSALAYARKVYDVPQEIIVAIIGVETFYGRITGKHRVIDALSTLAFAYPKREKFFKKELEQYLLLCREQNIDPLSLKGSYAGAMGYGQFMPSSYRHYAVDFDGQGIKDIWNNPVDAIGSVANYFKQHGWIKGEPVVTSATVQSHPEVNNRRLKPHTRLRDFKARGIDSPLTAKYPDKKAAIFMLEEKDGPRYWLGFNNFYVISRYNHSHMYSMVVYLLSQRLKKAFKSSSN